MLKAIDCMTQSSKKIIRSQAKKGRQTRSKRAGPKTQLHKLKIQDAFKFLKGLDTSSVDLIVSSPPYCMGKEYDTSNSIDQFLRDHRKLAPLLSKALKPGASLCWQVGHYVKDGAVVPLDALIYLIFRKQKDLILRNRIVWTFGHGLHATSRLSGRHETIMWFTKKGKQHKFNLDAVRVPQKYPGKKYYKGSKNGHWSGNPKGKNPSDVWDIPNVKANHVEKTDHPCQFPVALAQRLVKALSDRGDLVVDPFMGSGSTAVAAALEGRRFSGCDIESEYVKIARDRLGEMKKGTLKHRPLDRPIYQPNGKDSVSRKPKHFSFASG
jgi:adenine-specific DNA-methyltransferase